MGWLLSFNLRRDGQSTSSIESNIVAHDQYLVDIKVHQWLRLVEDAASDNCGVLFREMATRSLLSSRLLLQWNVNQNNQNDSIVSKGDSINSETSKNLTELVSSNDINQTEFLFRAWLVALQLMQVM